MSMAGIQRTPAIRFDNVPGKLPAASLPRDLDIASVERWTVERINDLQLPNLDTEAVWRDHVAFTGTYRTFNSPDVVYHTFEKLRQDKQCTSFQLQGTTNRPSPMGWLDIDMVFSTKQGELVGYGAGIVSVLFNERGERKIWMLRTWLENFEGNGHPDELEPHDKKSNGTPDQTPEIYDAIIAGGGHAGLSLAGRLQALGLRYILLEKNASIGDVWRNRYDSLRFHTVKEFGNLPFGRTYADEDDYCLPAKQIGKGHQDWAEKYGIHAQTSTEVRWARYDDFEKVWTISTATTAETSTFRAKYFILSTGPAHSTPILPSWATPEAVKASKFGGTLLHGSKYKSAGHWAGKRGIVIGTANTAHDVAEDMANSGMHTTMLQRGRTFVFPAPWLHHAEDLHYNTTLPTSIADRENFTYPNKIVREMTNKAVFGLIDANPERFDALERAGFRLNRYGDVYEHLYVRYGGHYVDIGASARIASGEIGITSKPVERLSDTGVVFQDGTELAADLIVACTGFEHDFRADAARVIGEEAAGRMDDYWNIDAEGEIRGLAKFAGHPNLFYFGGDIRISRWYSRFVALQIQADILGQPLERYGQ